MRHIDYPKGESDETRAATHEEIIKVLNDPTTRYKVHMKAMIMLLKDFWTQSKRRKTTKLWRRNQRNRQQRRIHTTKKTNQKTRNNRKSIHWKRSYRRTQRILRSKRTRLRTRSTRRTNRQIPNNQKMGFRKTTRILRRSMSSVIREAFFRNHIEETSAHSLRRFVQTNLEAGGVNVNWIDQIIGHKLINSRGA